MRDILLGISLILNVITAPYWIPQAQNLYSNITHTTTVSHHHSVSVDLNEN